MPNLVVEGSIAAGSSKVQIQYRLAGTSAWTLVQPAEPKLPYSIPNVDNGQYEVQVRSLCSNGSWSEWKGAGTAPCAAPTQFGVTKNGSNFVVSYAIGSNQNNIEVEMTQPNGSISRHPFVGNSIGNFNIPVPVNVTGDFGFRARVICDDTANPPFVSNYSQSVTVSVGASCNPPTLGAATLQNSGDFGATYRLGALGMTTSIRVTLFDPNDNQSAAQFVRNADSLDITVPKGQNYRVRVTNVCGNGGEGYADATINALVA